ncbi:MAG: NADPH2:quinone reductase [Hyphomicrobiales bacterium]|nr:NADPH2:quinone reductase [Hyphomicrobiales bacterium]
MKAIRIHAHGGPEQLRLEDIDLPAPGPGQVRVRHTAIALNFSDINVRRGGFYQPEPMAMPIIPGNEAAGVVASVGPGVDDWRPGQRVAYVGMDGPFYHHTGAYAQERNVPADRLVAVPDAISDEQACGLLLKGTTAASIIERVFPPRAGQVILIHAAASGVGSILTQWASHLGATVIGTAGSPAKAEAARRHGAAHTILYREVDFVAAVKQIVPEGAHAVFDGVGKDTFVRSMDCTAPFGTLVNYGNASGHVPPIDMIDLAIKGSLSICRPGVHYFLKDAARLRAAAGKLFDLAARGVLRVEIGATYALADAPQAHIDAEAGRHAGSIVLRP